MDEEKEQIKVDEELPEVENGDSEVGDFLDDFFSPEPEQEQEQEEAIDKPDEPVQDEQVAEEPDEESVVEEPKPVVEEQEQEPDQEPDDDIAQLRDQNQALLDHIEKLSGQVIGGAVVPPQQPQQQKPAAERPQQPQQRPAGELPNFLDGVSIDDLLEDPAKFNAVLGRVYQAAQEQSVQQATQQTLRSVPELVVGYITRHTAMNRMVDDFYKEHSDLSNVKQTVAAVANTVHSENPDWGVDQVFKETAQRTRNLLGLKKQAEQKVARSQAKKPAFAKQRGSRKEEPQIGGLQKEINDLLIDV